MKELTNTTPKPMLPIKNKPKLAWTIENLPDSIDEVIIIVGYLKEQIINFFQDSYDNKKITYLVQENLNGTAGSVEIAKNLIKYNEKFLVLMGDDFYKKSDLEKLLKYDFSVLSLQIKNAQNFGLLKKDSENNLISIIEKPHNEKIGLINTGAYVLRKEYFNTEKVKISETEFGLPQTMVKMSKETNKKIKVVEASDWFPVGDPEALKKAEKIIENFID